MLSSDSIPQTMDLNFYNSLKLAFGKEGKWIPHCVHVHNEWVVISYSSGDSTIFALNVMVLL